MASNEKNICNVLRDQWRALTEMVKLVSSPMRKLLAEIQALINRIKNTMVRRILNIIKDIGEMVSNFLGLQAIDNNKARQEFCRVLYSCKPALEKISKFISPELFEEIFGPANISTIDLSKYGLPPLYFSSKFELFEYVACRLSLRGLLDSVMDALIKQLLEFLSQFEKYLDINWWLENTVWGRYLKRLMAIYESLFNNAVKKYLEELEPFVKCAFAACDFAVSTENFLEDFRQRYKCERESTSAGTIWTVNKAGLYEDLEGSMNDAKAQIAIWKGYDYSPVPFRYKTDNEPSTEVKTDSALPYDTTERKKIDNRKDDLTLMSTTPSNRLVMLRKTINETTSGSEVIV